MRTFTSLAAATALATSACGGQGSSTKLFFLNADRSAPVAVARPGGLSARETLHALLEGPNAEEAGRGISTAIPSGTRVRGFRVEDGEARIHLSGLPAPSSAAERFRIITQLTKSLTGRSGARRLWLRNDGKPWGFWSRRGGIVEGPYRDGPCTSVGDGAPGTETVVADSFRSC